MNSYLILVAPFVAAITAQALKVVLSKRNKMTWRDFFALSYAGIPSGHSAFVVALVIMVSLVEGFDSSLFAVSLVFAVIVINDALKLRMYLGQQGEIINVLVEDLREDQFLDQNYPKMKERIGHTKIEVLAGSILGVITAILLYLIFS